MPKLFCALLLTLSLLIGSLPTAKAAPVLQTDAPPSLSAASAVLTDGTGQLLSAKDAHRRMGPASTTKIMTALVVLESCEPSEEVVIPREAVGVEGSSVYLCEGECLTVEQLLYALLLASANDAATALALHVSGSVSDFAVRMNERAAALGLSDTHFENPHGLASDAHYTTAYDLAVITAEALAVPLFAKIVSTYKTTIPLSGEEGVRVLVNHNKLLRLYDGAVGVKTGFTRATGRTLVSAAERDGLLLIAVTLDAPNDWQDHEALLDYGFAHYESVVLCTEGQIVSVLPVTGGVEEYVPLKAAETLRITLPRHRAVEPTVTTEATCHFLFAPVSADIPVARAVFLWNGHVLAVPLRTASSVNRLVPKRQGFWERILRFFSPDI